MKKIAFKAAALLMCMLVLSMSIVTAFAADTTVNGKPVKVGDTVTYTLNLADLTYPLAGVQMYLYYDNTKLELQEGSVSSESLPAAVINEKADKDSGRIIFLWSEGVLGEEFDEAKQLVTATFKVIAEGESDITYNIQEMYDIYYDRGSGAYLQRYTLTNSVEVNGEAVIENEAPILNENVSDSEKGDFVNNQTGKGEKNDVSVDEDATISTYSVETTLVDGSVAILDDDGNVVNGTVTINNAEDNNANTSAAQDTNQTANTVDSTTVFIIIAVIVLLAAVVVIVVVKKKESK